MANRANRKLYFGFALFCLLQGSTWLPNAAFPSLWPEPLRICFHDVVLAALFSCFAFASGRRGRARELLETSAWGAVLFAAPIAISAGAADVLGSLTPVLGLALVPAITVFLVAQKAEGEMRLLTPAILAMGGLTLVIPFAWPSSLSGLAWLGGIAICAFGLALAGIRLHRLLDGQTVASAGAAMCLGAVLASGAVSFAQHGAPLDLSLRRWSTEAAWALLIDGPLTLLTVWLLRELSPINFSARFVLVPVVTLLGGSLAAGAGFGWVGWLGMTLAAGASCLLGLSREPAHTGRGILFERGAP
jgi:drug/metabolite transporter (DMT)-like permease